MTETNASIRLRPIIRVFVSSTFSDLRQERNALQADVFPKLEQLCQKSGFQFQAIDLRWGVSSEAGLDHRTMRICFEELRRSQEVSPEPNFLVLLGDRYGWRPLPEEISVKEFEKLEGKASAESAEVLRSWYRLDENAVVGSLEGERPRESREIRVSEVTPDGRPTPKTGVYILQSRRQHLPDGTDYTLDAAWHEVQVVLWALINRAYPPEGLVERFADARQANGAMPAIVRFQASATEQEIWCGALSAENAERHVLAFFREIDNRDDFAPAEVKDFFDLTDDGQFDPTAAARQTSLKAAIRRRLGSDAVSTIPFKRLAHQGGKLAVDVSPEDLKTFCANVETRLQSIIERQIEQYWHPPQHASVERTVRELEIEQQEHARIGLERGGLECFVGREDKLKAIRDYLSADSTSLLVIHGTSGCGKTALIGRAAQEAGAILPPGGSGASPTAAGVAASPPTKMEATVLVRFIGVTPRSSDLRGLLTSLCQELRQRYPRDGDLPTDIKLLGMELREHFQTAAKSEQPLILFLDALDQLADTDGGRLLHWIPTGPLPAHVKLVVSCLSDRVKDDPAGQPYAELQRRQLPATQFINLEAFSEAEARTLLFERWLRQAGRTVSQDQRARIGQRLTSDTCRLPIYLKLLFEEARLWRSYDATPALGKDVPALLKQLFDRLSLPTNHGPLLVERVLGYLAASREGLAENEILEILFADPGYKKVLKRATKQNQHEIPPSATRIPIAIWSRLRFDLASYLTERAATGANVLTFYHRQVAECVQERSAKSSDQRWQPHQRLADYFTACAKGTDPQKEWETNSVRGFAECVFYLVKVGQHEQASGLLSNFPFLLHKLRVGLLEGVFEDYDIVRLEAPADMAKRLEIWADFFHGRAHILRRGNSEWPAYKILLQLAVEHADDSSLTMGAEQWLVEGRSDWLWLRRIPRWSHVPRNACRVVLEGHTSGVHGALQLGDGRILSWSSDKTLRMWDAASGRCLTVLVGHSSYVNGALTLSDGRLLSWSEDKTLRIWDGQSGACLAVLEGHSEHVSGALELGDGRILSWAYDKQLRLWDSCSGSSLGVLKGRTWVRGVFELSDGRIVSWDAGMDTGDNTLRIWDSMSGTCVAVLEGHTSLVVGALALNEDEILSWSADHTLRVWDISNRVCVAVLRGHTDIVIGALKLNDGQLVSWSYDKTLRLWDKVSGTCLGVMEGHTDLVKMVLALTDGRLLSWSKDHTLRIWEGRWGKCVAVLEGHRLAVEGALELDGGRILSWSHDDTLRIWDGSSAVCLGVLRGHTRGVQGALKLGKWLILSWSWDDTLRIWNGNIGRESSSLQGHTYQVTGTLSLLGGRMLSWAGGYLSNDNTLRLWDCSSATCEAVLAKHKGRPIGALALSGGRILSWASDNALRIWDGRNGVCLAVLEGHTEPVAGALELSDGRIVTWPEDTTLLMWDSRDGACVAVLEGHTNTITGARMLRSGRILTWSGYSVLDYTLRLWDERRAVCLAVCEGHNDGVTGAIELGDGRILSWSADSTLRIWDESSGGCVAVLEGHASSVGGVRWLGDGRILSWSADSVRIWDGSSGVCLSVLEGLGLEGPSGRIEDTVELVTGQILLWSFDTFWLWNYRSRRCSGAMREDCVAREHPEWLHARAAVERPDAVNSGFWVSDCGRRTSLQHRTMSLRTTTWQAESDATARCLLPDGTAVVTQADGQVCILKLHHGQRRVTLAEALLASQTKAEVPR